MKLARPRTEYFTLFTWRVLAQLAEIIACAYLMCVGADAQVAGGVLSGAATASERTLPNARVTIKNVATGVERAATTNEGGVYAAPNLVPGTYEMTVEAPGFSTQVRTDIAVAVGAKLVVNVTMQHGDPKEVIRAAVTGTSEDQASSAGNRNVSASTVRDSPLNGRDWTQLAALEAGVTGVQTGAVQAPRFRSRDQRFRSPP
jgi:hypothetical protein